MVISSWNVNSVRARINNIIKYLKSKSPDILMIQEIKTEDKNFPYEDFKNLGYKSYVNGQKSYNGVAFISKINLEMFFKEFNKWFNDQVKLEDKDFLNNIKYFEKKLLSYEIKNLLFNSSKNFYLLHKIVNHPDLFEKLKFLIAFLMPKQVVNYFKK